MRIMDYWVVGFSRNCSFRIALQFSNCPHDVDDGYAGKLFRGLAFLASEQFAMRRVLVKASFLIRFRDAYGRESRP